MTHSNKTPKWNEAVTYSDTDILGHCGQHAYNLRALSRREINGEAVPDPERNEIVLAAARFARLAHNRSLRMRNRPGIDQRQIVAMEDARDQVLAALNLSGDRHEKGKAGVKMQREPINVERLDALEKKYAEKEPWKTPNQTNQPTNEVKK